MLFIKLCTYFSHPRSDLGIFLCRFFFGGNARMRKRVARHAADAREWTQITSQRRMPGTVYAALAPVNSRIADCGLLADGIDYPASPRAASISDGGGPDRWSVGSHTRLWCDRNAPSAPHEAPKALRMSRPAVMAVMAFAWSK